MPASWMLQAGPTDRNRPAAPSQCRARPSTPTTVSGLPWSHVRLQGCSEQFLGILAGIAAGLTAVLHPPAQHPGACGRRGRTGRARGVATSQKRLMPFDDLLGDRRTLKRNKSEFAIKGNALEQQE